VRTQHKIRRFLHQQCGVRSWRPLPVRNGKLPP